MKEYDAVIFDLDGVILDSDKDGFEWANRIREEANYDVDKLRVLFETDSEDEFRSKMEEYPFDYNYLKTVEKKVARKKINLVEKGDIRLYEDAEDLLEIIDQPIALISNAYGGTLTDILDILDLQDRIDFYYAPRLSYIEKYPEEMKPEPFMVNKAIENLDAQNPLMVGDSESDIEAARAAGIDSVYLDRSGKVLDKATYSVENLNELSQII